MSYGCKDMVGGVSKVDTPSDFNTYLTQHLQKSLEIWEKRTVQ